MVMYLAKNVVVEAGISYAAAVAKIILTAVAHWCSRTGDVAQRVTIQ